MANRICSIADCGLPVKSRGMCNKHYRRAWAAEQPLCAVEGCPSRADSRGWCNRHYQRWRACGDPGEVALRKAPSGTHGGMSRAGYPWFYDKEVGGMVYVHRAVMESHLGRPLLVGEKVHHINGDRTDHRIENLELWSTSQPMGQRVADKVAWAREILALYGEDF